MKVKYAFSLDCGYSIDAEDAYELFWLGMIEDQQSFECIGDDCNAQITCANLYKLQEDMKVLPYFQVYGEHSDNCIEQQNIIQNRSSQVNNNLAKSRGTIDDQSIDILHLKRPKSHTVTKQKSLKLRSEKQSNSNIKRKAIKSRTEKNRYSIRPIVNSFHEYRKKGCLKNKCIRIGRWKDTYAQTFLEINSQDLNNLSECQKVYWGQAYLYDNQSYYNILFSNHLVLDGENIRPSIYISHEMIESTLCSRLVEKKFKSLSNSYIYCFIYSLPVAKHRENKNYVNFHIKNIDLLDIRVEF